MCSSFKVLIVVCLFGFLANPSEQGASSHETWDGQEPGIQLASEYNYLNGYLIDKVGSTEPILANMDALTARMSSKEPDEDEMTVLKKLTSLKLTEGKCDKLSYDILEDNDEATGYKSHDVTSKKSAPRRLDKLINYYGKQHAVTCSKATGDLLKPKLKLVDREVLNRLSTWLDPMIERIVANYKPGKDLKRAGNDLATTLFRSIIMNGDQNPELLEVGTAYNAIKELVKNNPDEEKYLHYVTNERIGIKQFDRGMLQSLYTKYLQDSCNVFIGHMGKLFYRAKLDAQFHHDVNTSEPNLYRAWAYVELCSDAFVRPGGRNFRKFSKWPIGELKNYAQNIADTEENDDDDNDDDDDEDNDKSNVAVV